MKRLSAAIVEAERFLNIAYEAASVMSAITSVGHPNRERAAAKRASLDLTRALAQFRRSPYE